MRKSMTRARRSAAAVHCRPEILELLLTEGARKALKGRGRKGDPPVKAVSGMLRKRFGEDMELPAG